MPQNEDVNSLLQGHAQEVLIHLIDTRKELDFFLSSEDRSEKTNENTLIENTSIEITSDENKKVIESETYDNRASEPIATGLNASNPYNIVYQGKEAMYHIKGFKADQMDSLKITIQIQSL